jgi:hypothetical protein
MPGSSGQLLLRLLSEADTTMRYSNPDILAKESINKDQASLEVNYDIQIPKKTVNWFLDKQQPSKVEDYLMFFEFLSTFLISSKQKWSSSVKFYENSSYTLTNHKLIYGIHSYEKLIPISEMSEQGFNIRRISLVAETPEGMKYQRDRAQKCYPRGYDVWDPELQAFNSKPHQEKFDLCTLLSQHDSASIMTWLRNHLTHDYDESKTHKLQSILDTYLREVVVHV